MYYIDSCIKYYGIMEEHCTGAMIQFFYKDFSWNILLLAYGEFTVSSKMYFVIYFFISLFYSEIKGSS